jgi:hypothetical protein
MKNLDKNTLKRKHEKRKRERKYSKDKKNEEADIAFSD